MQIHFIRNATVVLQAGPEAILVDPMLGPKGSLSPYAFFRFRPRRNPTVPLPENLKPVLKTITAGLVTHCRWGHYDHLDRAGWQLLARKQIPVYCNYLDETYLRRRGIITVPLRPNQEHEFLGGCITPIPTSHGYGLMRKLMGPGLGYLVELPGEPSLYISGDTVLTAPVQEILTQLRPDVAVLNAGSASLDLGRPILMPMAEMLEFIRLAPGTVIAVHMETLNHCPTTRDMLRESIAQAGLADKVLIPADGELLSI